MLCYSKSFRLVLYFQVRQRVSLRVDSIKFSNVAGWQILDLPQKSCQKTKHCSLFCCRASNEENSFMSSTWFEKREKTNCEPLNYDSVMLPLCCAHPLKLKTHFYLFLKETSWSVFFGCHDTKHNNTRHNNARHNNTRCWNYNVMSAITMSHSTAIKMSYSASQHSMQNFGYRAHKSECCCYAECHYTKCH